MKYKARMTTVSIEASHSTETITRRPDRGYGIHVSACAQASSAAASSAGQITGMSNPGGQIAIMRAASQKTTTTTEP